MRAAVCCAFGQPLVVEEVEIDPPGPGEVAIIARGVMLDVAATKGVAMLPDSYPTTPEDQETLDRQRLRLEEGDVVLIPTGRMTVWDDPQKFPVNGPGIDVRAAQWLVEGHGAMIVGADQATVEYQPATDVPGHFLPVHLYLLAEMEITFLEELARDRAYEFVFFGAPLRLRGATGSPLHPWAMPLRA